MKDFRLELFTAREKRAAAVFGVAALVLAASVLYVVRPAARPAAAPAHVTMTVITPPPQPYAYFWFLSPTTALAVAGSTPGPEPAAFRTTDGARTWKRLAPLPGFLSLDVFLQPLADGGLLAGGTEFGPYWLSQDQGASWRPFRVPADIGDPTLRLLDSRTGVLVRRSPAVGAGARLSIDWTHDAGASWRRTLQLDADQPAAGALDLSSPFVTPTFVNDRDGWTMSGSLVPRAGVQRPALLRTTDAGSTWREVALVSEPDRSYSLNAPVFPGGGRHGYLSLSGASGMVIYESVDGGDTWTDPYPAPVSWFSTAPDRWLAADGSSLLTSHDWGRTWSARPGRLPKPNLVLGFVEATGSVVWSYGGLFRGGQGAGPPVLLRSTDGGAIWAEARWPGS